MTRQLYELDHPLYPHKDLLKYHNDHKIKYVPYTGAYDESYNDWYQLVRADHDQSGAPKRPIYREVTQILRLKVSGNEKVLYSEYLTGYDHENMPQPFFHTYGSYVKPYFRTVYNYELRRSSTIRSGQFETVYFIDWSPELIDTLYNAAPDNSSIELLINAGSMQYGGRDFFRPVDFRDLPLEELARQGSSGKGMHTVPTVNIPTNTMITQLKAEGNTSAEQQKLWQEFQEFQKFKQSQPIQTENNVSARKVKISPPDEK